MTPLNKVADGKEIKEFLVCVADQTMIFKPILDDISFFAIVKDKDDAKVLREWVLNKISELRGVFPSKT